MMYNNKIKKIKFYKFLWTFSLLLLISFLLSCSYDEPSQGSRFAISLEASDTIRIPTPNNIPEIAMSDKWSFDKDHLSFILSQENIKLYMYSFNKETWNNYNLSILSKNYISHSGLYGFLNDSILLYDLYNKNEVLLFNINSGSIVDKILMDEHYGIAHNSILKFYHNNEIIVLPVMYKNIFDDNYNEKSKTAVVIDWQSKNKIYIKNLKDIDTQNNRRVNTLIPDVLVDSGEIIVSYRNIDSLFSYDYNSHLRISKSCKDPFIINSLENKNLDNDFINAYLEEFNGLYKSILKDGPYFYRVSVSYPKFNGEIPSSEDELNNIMKNRQVTVSVLNERLDLITQSILKGINENNCFVRNGKIYLRSNHSSEGEILYIGYKVKKRKLTIEKQEVKL